MGIEDRWYGDNRLPKIYESKALKVLWQELDVFVTIILFCNQLHSLVGVYGLIDFGRVILIYFSLGSGPEYSKHLSSLHCTICLEQK